MKTVYMVVRKGSVYEVETEDVVAAYLDLDMAKLHVEQIRRRLPELLEETRKANRLRHRDSVVLAIAEFALDPGVSIDGDSSYFVRPVPLVSHPDEYMERIDRQ